MLLFVIGLIIFEMFVSEIFLINIGEILDIRKYWRVAIGLWVLIRLRSAPKLYRRLNDRDFLRNIKSGEYNYTTPENIFLELIEEYSVNIEMQIEKMGIMKSLTPISLLPLIAGYVLEGKDIKINWNWFTIAMVAVLLIYLYNLWKCYYDMRFWKFRKIEIQRELREFKTTKEDEG